MMTTLKRLLRYPHAAVFDKAPDPAIALKVRHPDSMTWKVEEGWLELSTGGVTTLYDLSNLTIGLLAAAMEADGYEVDELRPELAGYSAMVLIEGSGTDATPNGDQLLGFTNDLWSLFSAYAQELRQAKAQISQALRQMVIHQAEGEWLTLWGQLYDQQRQRDQSDAELAEQIPREAFRLRVNKLAIEKAILDHTGKYVMLEEPWRNMFRLDFSRLSGGDRFYDGSETGYFLIRPVSKTSIDWTDVLEVIERNRPVGVIILEPETRSGQFIELILDGTIWSSAGVQHVDFLRFWDEGRLDFMRLDDEKITQNWKGVIVNVTSSLNITSSTWRHSGGWDDRTWESAESLDELDGTILSKATELP